MTVLTDLESGARLDAAPELRLVPYAFEQVYGTPATGVWRAPGGLTLFGGRDEQFAVAVPVRWGAIVAAGRQPEGLVELRSMNQPALHVEVPAGYALAGPAWAEPALAVARAVAASGSPVAGIRLLLHSDLPKGCGVLDADVALVSACIAMFEATVGTVPALESLAGPFDMAALVASLGCPDDAAVLVDLERLTVEHLPFDLGGAGLRLMVVDLGIDRPEAGRTSGGGSVGQAADRLRNGDLRGFGAMLGRPTEVPDQIGAVLGAVLGAGALGAYLPPSRRDNAAASVVALVPAADVADVRAAARRAWHGRRPLRFLTASASRGGSPVVPGSSVRPPGRRRAR